MTEIIQDSVDVDLQIGTESITESGFSNRTEDSFNDDAIFWDVVEAKVELSQVVSPNYVKGKIIPQPEFINVLQEIVSEPIGESDAPDEATSQGNTPNNGWSNFIGARFRLEARTEFGISRVDDKLANRTNPSEVSDTDETDSLLFDGRLANISPVGTNLYEFIAYDPGHQAFNIGEGSGSIINQTLDLTGNTVEIYNAAGEVSNASGNTSKRAIKIVEEVVEEANLEGAKSDIQDSAFKSEDGNYISVDFNNIVVPVKDALNKVREATNTEWWFGKEGTLYFGDPETHGGGLSVYDLTFIKDSSAGITTPPYQSVRVIGSGVATSEGWANNAKIQDEENRIIKEVNIGLPTANDTTGTNIAIETDPEGELNEPTFKYINAELSTDEHVKNTAFTIAEDLIKQQGSGKVTVVGFPEVEPFDGIRMPNTAEQPMGGQPYGVYSVTHKLNGSDGFITEIEVAGPNAAQVRGTVPAGEDNLDDISIAGEDNEFDNTGTGDDE